MPKIWSCITIEIDRKRSDQQAETNDSLPPRPVTSSASKPDSSAIPARSKSSSSAKSARKSSTEDNEVTIESVTRSAGRSSNRRSAWRRRRDLDNCIRRPKITFHFENPQDEDDENDEELAALARLRVKALAHLSGPYGKERDPEGYVTQQAHRFSSRRTDDARRIYVPYVSHRLVKIDTLGDIEQNCVYERSLYQATMAQVRQQYDLHCQRLESIRCVIKREMQYRKDRRLGNMDYDAWCGLTSQMQMARISTIAERAEGAYIDAQRCFDDRLFHRTVEKGVVRLLERCEAILKKSDRTFKPSPWRLQSPLRSRRWVDGKRGWTGLEL